MKRNLLNSVLCVALLLLAAANVLVWRNPQTSAQAAATNAERTSSDDASQISEPRNESSPLKSDSPPSSQPPRPNWQSVETDNYKQYAANLRLLGFPEKLVRSILIADLNKHYEAREASLSPKVVPFDAPVAQRQRKVTDEDLLQMRQLREVLREKQATLKEVLGVYVPRETITTPTARNYIAYEYALDMLPPEKRDAAQLALEDEWFVDDLNKYLDRPEYVAAYKITRTERNKALLSVLTPEEFERFEMHSNPAGTELARRTIGMEPSETEFPEMFRIAANHWVETGGVGGLWRAERVPRDQIAAADQKMDLQMQEALGPDRYLDYQMAINETGQQLRNLAARYDLPRETLVQVFRLQAEADTLHKQLKGSEQAATHPRLTELRTQSEQLLGPTVWQAWDSNRSNRPDFKP